MSIGGIGAHGSADAGQILLRMLSHLGNANDVPSDANSNSSNTSFDQASAASGSTSNSLTGTGQAPLSDDILALLVHLQAQTGSGGPQGSSTAGISTAAQTISTSDPVQQLFSAIDSDGDGSVSQSEMEAYIEGKGGTQGQADALFSALNQSASSQNGSAGISEQQFANDVSQPHASGLHHHHRHHGGSGVGFPDSASVSNASSQIFGALDSNQDGSVSPDEFAAAFASGSSTGATGANSSNSSALFAQIDSNGDGSMSSTELGDFLSTLTQQIQSDFSALGALGRLATQSYDSSAGLLNKAAVEPSTFA